MPINASVVIDRRQGLIAAGGSREKKKVRNHPNSLWVHTASHHTVISRWDKPRRKVVVALERRFACLFDLVKYRYLTGARVENAMIDECWNVDVLRGGTVELVKHYVQRCMSMLSSRWSLGSTGFLNRSLQVCSQDRLFKRRSKLQLSISVRFVELLPTKIPQYWALHSWQWPHSCQNGDVLLAPNKRSRRLKVSWSIKSVSANRRQFDRTRHTQPCAGIRWLRRRRRVPKMD